MSGKEGKSEGFSLSGIMDSLRGLGGKKTGKPGEAPASAGETAAVKDEMEMEKYIKDEFEALKAEVESLQKRDAFKKTPEKADEAMRGFVDKIHQEFFRWAAATAVQNPGPGWAKIEERIGKVIEAAKARPAAELPELQNIDQFIADLEIASGLKENDGMYETLGSMIRATGFMGDMLYDFLQDWANDLKDPETGAESSMGALCRRLADTAAPEKAAEREMEHFKRKRDGSKKDPETQPETNDFFEEFGIDPKKDEGAKADYAALTKAYDDYQVETFAKNAHRPNSFVRHIYKTAADKLGGTNKLAARVLDIRLMALPKDHRPTVLQALRDCANPTPNHLREFLNAIDVNDPDSIVTAIAEHLPKTT